MSYLAFDCETTGLLPNCNVLTVYFVILDDKLNILDELDLKIKHDFYVVFTKALEVNHINLLEHDKIAISKIEARSQIIKFFKKYENKYQIIGHNIKFDIDMLINNKILMANEINTYFHTGYLDTYKITQLLKSKKKINKCQSLSLSKLCYYFDINNESSDNNFHNCKYDTLSTIELFKKLIELKNSE
jgi:DNA polymerase III epsilon subunit-like protein